MLRETVLFVLLFIYLKYSHACTGSAFPSSHSTDNAARCGDPDTLCLRLRVWVRETRPDGLTSAAGSNWDTTWCRRTARWAGRDFRSSMFWKQLHCPLICRDMWKPLEFFKKATVRKTKELRSNGSAPHLFNWNKNWAILECLQRHSNTPGRAYNRNNSPKYSPEHWVQYNGM